MSSNIDYKNEAHLFLGLLKKGQKTTQTEFCRRRSAELGKKISVQYFGKVLREIRKKSAPKKKQNTTQKPTQRRRRDWGELKAEFLAGPYTSISEFARACGLNESSHHFRKKTEGWRDEKAKIEQKINKRVAQQLSEDKTAEKVCNIYADALIIQLELFELLESLARSHRNWKPIKSSSDALAAAKFSTEIQTAIERIVPNIRGLHKMSQVNAVLGQLSDGKIDIAQASIKLTILGVKLPRALELLLSKHQPEEIPPDDDDYIDEAKILERRRTILLEIENERETLVPDRKKFVNDLKKQMKDRDSFSAEAIERTKP